MAFAVILIINTYVARGGLEPPLTAPKTAVLPLDDRAINCFFKQMQMI